MARSTTRNTSDESEARIGSGAQVRGRIAGDGDLTVEGRVEGDIVLRGLLTIAEGGTVAADTVEAEEITVAGTLEGELRVKGPVRALAGARVRGNIRGGNLALEEGAEFSGRVDFDFELPAELESGAPAAANGGGARLPAASGRR
ncbi:polymer-forming cytoskeletal protein [Pendulispora albinea]|uniref:Polymer-forming cytoskeletal protein n=1 Tax=Pendulispora albinea TaxID=2741071 RepID=A0ABZ2LU28_9BACT